MIMLHRMSRIGIGPLKNGIERVTRCIASLHDLALAYPGRLTVIEGDALALDPADLVAAPRRIVSIALPNSSGLRISVTKAKAGAADRAAAPGRGPQPRAKRPVRPLRQAG